MSVCQLRHHQHYVYLALFPGRVRGENAWTGNEAIYVCSTQFRNLRNLEIALRIVGIPKLRANLEIAQTILRLRNTFAQPRDCANILRNHRTFDLSHVVEDRAMLAGRKPFTSGLLLQG